MLTTVLSRLLHTAQFYHSRDGSPKGEADPGDGSAPASDGVGWSDWETNDQTARKKTVGGNSTGGIGSSRAKGKRGRGGQSGGAGAGRGKGKGKGKGRAGVGVGSEGERQLDVVSSFKAGALSESARHGHTLILACMGMGCWLLLLWLGGV